MKNNKYIVRVTLLTRKNAHTLVDTTTTKENAQRIANGWHRQLTKSGLTMASKTEATTAKVCEYRTEEITILVLMGQM